MFRKVMLIVFAAFNQLLKRINPRHIHTCTQQVN